MTPLEMMQRRRAPLRLAIFDCDGVIVDSEPVSNRITAAACTELGWTMTAAEAETNFLGMTLTDMVPVIEARIGRDVPTDWQAEVMRRLVEALSFEATPIPGAIEALQAASALGLPWRIASNSSHEEMAVKFQRVAMVELVAGRMHSARDVARGKPAPDVFLHAAAAAGVPPAACLVVEDSVPGAQAARAAGMACIGLAPHGDDPALREAGAVLIRSFSELPVLLRDAMR
jgi:HAD superfamily hydrolase (TIGR01509 family)